VAYFIAEKAYLRSADVKLLATHASRGPGRERSVDSQRVHVFSESSCVMHGLNALSPAGDDRRFLCSF
jgi:hypothetical protein